MMPGAWIVKSYERLTNKNKISYHVSYTMRQGVQYAMRAVQRLDAGNKDFILFLVWFVSAYNVMDARRRFILGAAGRDRKCHVR